MCFSTASSLTAWAIALVIAIFLYQRNENFDRWNAAFLATFTLIQLLEGGMWSKGLEPTEKSQNTNEILTKLILLALLLQPLVQSFAGWKTTGEPLLGWTSLLFLLMLGYGIWRVFSAEKGDFFTNVGKKGHLVWNDKSTPNNFLEGWLPTIAYLVGLFLPLYFMTGSEGSSFAPGFWLFTVGVITAIYAMVVAGANEFSSMWCITSVIYGVFAIFV